MNHLKNFAAGLPSLVVLGQAANRLYSVQKLQFPSNPYLSACWMVQRLTSSRLARSRWLTPSTALPECTPLLLGQAGRRPGKRPSARAFAWPATERSLIEFRHHSLKASTIESWSLPVGVEVSKSSASDRNSTPAWCRPSITCSP